MNCQHPAQENQILTAEESKFIKAVKAFGQMLGCWRTLPGSKMGLGKETPVPLLTKVQLVFLIFPSYLKERSQGKKWGRRFCFKVEYYESHSEYVELHCHTFY